MPSILIVDDSEYSRRLLKQQFAQLGHEVFEAEDGAAAWDLLQKEPINMVITDWVMPNVSGLELCRLIRKANFPRYIYIILITVKDDKGDMVTGIEAGADSFLVKPCTTAQLRVMVHSARRVLKYERALVDRNRRLARAHTELKHGLRSAASFHQTLLPPLKSEIEGVSFQARYKACEYTTGDMFNYFQLDDDHLGFYLLDVAGHGVPAAMFSFTLSHFLSNVPIEGIGSTQTVLNFSKPAEVSSALNNRFQTRGDDWLSFTMIYGLIDLKEQRVTFTQAGHPPLVYQGKGEPARELGEGGFPVGFFSEVTYDEYAFQYKAGDRIFVYSDGITECQNEEKQPFTVKRLMECLDRSRVLSLERTLEVVVAELAKWRGSPNFGDDVSILAIEFGPRFSS